MEPNIKEVAGRIRALREDMDLTLQEMAEATGRSTAEYAAQESGEEDLSFTFLYKCAEKFGVDVIELLTGENPHLTGYSLTREGAGLSVPVHLSRHEGQELDFIISGQMRFAYEDHEEILNPGDVVMYDSGRGHGMIATGGEPCVFLAIVMKPEGEKII